MATSPTLFELGFDIALAFLVKNTDNVLVAGVPLESKASRACRIIDEFARTVTHTLPDDEVATPRESLRSPLELATELMVAFLGHTSMDFSGTENTLAERVQRSAQILSRFCRAMSLGMAKERPEVVRCERAMGEMALDITRAFMKNNPAYLEDLNLESKIRSLCEIYSQFFAVLAAAAKEGSLRSPAKLKSTLLLTVKALGRFLDRYPIEYTGPDNTLRQRAARFAGQIPVAYQAIADTNRQADESRFKESMTPLEAASDIALFFLKNNQANLFRESNTMNDKVERAGEIIPIIYSGVKRALLHAPPSAYSSKEEDVPTLASKFALAFFRQNVVMTGGEEDALEGKARRAYGVFPQFANALQQCLTSRLT